jgi:hypothetical protein
MQKIVKILKAFVLLSFRVFVMKSLCKSVSVANKKSASSA